MGSERGTQDEFEIGTGHQLRITLPWGSRVTKKRESISVLCSSHQSSQCILRIGRPAYCILVSRNAWNGTRGNAGNRSSETCDPTMLPLKDELWMLSVETVSNFMGEENTKHWRGEPCQDWTRIEGHCSEVWIWMASWLYVQLGGKQLCYGNR